MIELLWTYRLWAWWVVVSTLAVWAYTQGWEFGG